MAERAAIVALTILGSTAGAQATLTLGLPTFHDSMGAAPVISVTVSGVPPQLEPVTIELEIATDPLFAQKLPVLSQTGLIAAFTVARLLPAKTKIYFRATAFDVFGGVQAANTGSATTRSWLSIVSPQGPTNVVVYSAQPTFVWSSAPVTSGPGPWIYDLSVTNTATQQVDLFAPGLSDTSFTPTTPLQANTSYHWSVAGRLANDPADQVSVASSSSFVVSSPTAPLVTLFYQNFPNPFPQPSSAVTCFWFDLAHPSHVDLIIYSITGIKVKTIVPGAFGDVLPVGAYGRLNAGNQSGCDPRVSWDGTDQRGRKVPPGVYIAVFHGDGVTDSKKIVFKGQ